MSAPPPHPSSDPRLRPYFELLTETHEPPLLDSIRARMLDLLAQGPRCLDREHTEPGHFTASGFVLSPDLEQLLLIRHRKLGLWLQPGGHIEAADPSPLEAALREVQEESSLRSVELLRPLVDLDIHQIPAWGEVGAHLHFDLRVLFRAESWEVQGESRDSPARWFPLHQLCSVTARDELADGRSTDASVLKVAARLERGLLSRGPNR